MQSSETNYPRLDWRRNSRIDRIVGFDGVRRVDFGHLDDALRVVQEEAAEEDQAPVHADGVQACTEGCTGRQEHGACSGPG